MTKRVMAMVVVVALLAGCGQKKKEEAQVVGLDEVRAGFVEDAKKADAKRKKKEVKEYREGWAAKELKKEGYTPGEMTKEDHRKILGAE